APATVLARDATDVEARADSGDHARRRVDLQQSKCYLARFQRRRTARSNPHPRILRVQGCVQPISLRLRCGALDDYFLDLARVFYVVSAAQPRDRKRLRLKMREPKLITALRHAILLAFVAISVYPALNVL